MIEYSKEAHEICKRPYTKYAFLDDAHCYIARCKEFDGCMSQGDTAKEALTMLEDAMLLWVQCQLDDNLPIPEPTSRYMYTDNTNTASYYYSIDFGDL